MVKNHFYSTIRKNLKILNRFRKLAIVDKMLLDFPKLVSVKMVSEHIQNGSLDYVTLKQLFDYKIKRVQQNTLVKVFNAAVKLTQNGNILGLSAVRQLNTFKECIHTVSLLDEKSRLNLLITLCVQAGSPKSNSKSINTTKTSMSSGSTCQDKTLEPQKLIIDANSDSSKISGIKNSQNQNEILTSTKPTATRCSSLKSGD